MKKLYNRYASAKTMNNAGAILISLLMVMLLAGSANAQETVITVPGYTVVGPQNIITICVGGSVTFSVENSTFDHTYSLYKSGFNQDITSTVEGSTITFTPLSFLSIPSSPPVYTIIDLDDEDPIVPWISFKIVVVADPISSTMTKTPNLSSVCDNQDVSASVNVAGSGGVSCSNIYEYRTQTSIDGWISWASYTAGTSISTAGKTGVEIRASRGGCGGSGCYVDANIYSWTVVNDFEIQTQPEGATVCYGDRHEMSLTVTGGVPAYSYQWQSSETQYGTYLDISGAQSPTYKPAADNPVSDRTTWYQCKINSATGSGCPEQITTPVSITERAQFIPGNISNASQSICYHHDATTLNVSPTGANGTYSYKWFYKLTGDCDGSGWTEIPSTNSPSYTPTALTTTTIYRCEITPTGTPSCGALWTDNCATITVSSLESALMVDPSYNSSTPGWGCTKFASIQNAVDRLELGDAGGTINIAATAYDESVTVKKTGITFISSGIIDIQHNLSLANAGVTLTMDGDLTIDGTLTLTDVDDYLVIDNNTLTLNGAIAGDGSLSGSNASGLVITGSGTFGTVNISGPLGALTINRASQTIKLGICDFVFEVDHLALTNGILELNANMLKVSQSYSRNSGSIKGDASASLFFGAAMTVSGNLVFDASGQALAELTSDMAGSITLTTPLTSTSVTWNNGTFVTGSSAALTAGVLTVEVTATLTTGAALQAATLTNIGAVNLGGDAVITDMLTMGDFSNPLVLSSLDFRGRTLTLEGTINVTETSSFITNATSNLILNGSTAWDLHHAITLLGDLTINRSGGVTMTHDLDVRNVLTLTNGDFTMGAYTLTINNAMAGSLGNLKSDASSELYIWGTGAGIHIPALGNLLLLTVNNPNGAAIDGAISIHDKLTLRNGLLSGGGNLIMLDGKTIDRYRSGAIWGRLDAEPEFGASVNVRYIGDTRMTTGFELPTASVVTDVTVGNNSAGVDLGGDRVIHNLTFFYGDFSIGSKTLTLNGGLTFQNYGTLVGGTTSNLILGGTAAFNLPSSVSALNDLTIDRSGGVSLLGDLSLEGFLYLTSGNFNLGNYRLTLKKQIQGTTANLVATSSSKITIAGTVSGIVIPSTVTALNNFTLNNAQGTTLQGVLALASLTLTNGLMNLGGYNLTTVTASGNSDSYVVANALQAGRFAMTGVTGSVTMPVGYGIGSYTPLQVSNTAPEDFSIAIRQISNMSDFTYPVPSPDFVQLEWELARTGSGTAEVTFNWNYEGYGSAPTEVGHYSTSVWSPAGTITASSTTSVTVSGVTAFSPFAAYGSKLAVVYVDDINGNDTYTGEHATNSPAGTGPKKTMTEAHNVVVGDGTGKLIIADGTSYAEDLAVSKTLIFETTTPTAGTFTLGQTLTVTGTHVITMNGNMVVQGALTLTASGDKINVGAHSLSLGSSWSGNGFIVGGATSNLSLGGPVSSFNLESNVLYDLTINGAGTVVLNTNFAVDGTLALTNPTDYLAIGSHTLTLNGTLSGDGYLQGTSSSILTINGSGAFGTMNLNGELSTLNLLRGSSGTITLGTCSYPFKVDILSLSAGNLDLGDNLLEIDGVYTRGSGTFYASTTSLAGLYFSGLTTGELIFSGGTPILPELYLNTPMSINIGTAMEIGSAMVNTGELTTSEAVTFGMIENAANITLGDDASVTGLFALTDPAAIFAVGGNTLTFNGDITGTEFGTLQADATSTLVFNGTTEFDLPSNISELKNLTINRIDGVNLTGDLDVKNDLMLTSGDFSIGGHKLTINNAIGGNLANLKSDASSTFEVALSGLGTGSGIHVPALSDLKELILDNSHGAIVDGGITIHDQLTLKSGILSGSDNLSIMTGKTIDRSGGSLSAEPTFFTSVKVHYTGSSLITTGYELPDGFSPAITDVTVDNGGAGVKLGNNRVIHDLTLTNGDFSIDGKTLTINGDLSVTTGQLNGGITSNLSLGGTAAFNLPSNITDLNDLEINRTGGVSLLGDLSLEGFLYLTTGDFNLTGNRLTIKSPIQGVTDNLVTTSSSKITIAGSVSGIIIPSTVTVLNNLKLDNVAGTALQGALSLGSLTLTNGLINLGNYDLTTAVVTGSSSSYVIADAATAGKFKVTGVTSAVSMPVGYSSSSYTPLSVSNSTSADFAIAIKHIENMSDFTSPVPSPEWVKLEWELERTGGGTAEVTFRWNSGEQHPDVFTPSAVGHFDGTAWLPAGSISATTTSATVSGITSFSPFAAYGGLIDPVYVNDVTGSNANTGETPDNIPAGTGPKKTIEQGLTVVINTGGTIYVADGTYNLTSPLDITKEVSIIGNIATPANVVVNAPSGGVISGANSCFVVMADNVSIKGFRIQGAFHTALAQNAGIYVNDQALGHSGLENITISNNELFNNGYGIIAADLRNSIISYNKVYSSKKVTGKESESGVGIVLYGRHEDALRTYNVTIDHNEVYNNETEGIRVDVESGAGGTNFVNDLAIVISTNTIYNNGSTIGGVDKFVGIKSAGWSKGVTLSLNEIYNHKGATISPSSGNAGIWIAASNDWEISSDNNIHDNLNGIFFAYSTFDPGSGSHVINGNDIHGNVRGISIDDGSEAVVNYNKIYSNNSTTFSGIGYTPFGVYNNSTTDLDAKYNWWGSAKGPTVSSNVCGDGDRITSNVTYEPWYNNDVFTTQVYKLVAYTIGGTKSVCIAEHTNITLSGSQNGSNYKYKLYKDGIEVPGSEQDGTGSSLSWNVTTSTTSLYTVKARNTLNSCELDMSGSARLYVGPVTVISSLSGHCEGASIDVPVKVASFVQVGSITLTLNYNSALTYAGYTVPIGGPAVTIFPAGSGVLTVAYMVTNPLAPITLPDSSTLFTLQFTYNGGNGTVTFYDPPEQTEACEYAWIEPPAHPGDPLSYVPFCDIPKANYYFDGTVTGFLRPRASLTGTTAMCLNQSTDLSISFTEGTAPWYYSINGGAEVTASTNPETIHVSPTTTTDYSITSLRDAHCTSISADYAGTVRVTVNPLPDAPIAGDYNNSYDGATHWGTATPPVDSHIVWYTASSGGTETVAPSRKYVGSSSAWAESVVNTTGCKSTSRTLVTVTITNKPVTVTAVTDTKIYDGGISSSAVPMVGPLASGDVVNAVPTQTYDNKTVGTGHVMTAVGLTIKDALSADVTSNYTITYDKDYTGVINLKAVSVTAVTDTKTYDGGVTSSASPIVGTLATGDAVLAAPTQVYDDKNIGTTHVLSASGLTIKDAGNVDVTANYTITYVPSAATGVINLKAVSVTAVTDTKTYDGGVTSSALPIVGTLAAGDAVLAAPTQVYDNKNIGTMHVLTASGLTIKDAGNVDVTANYTITYVPSPATGVINLKAVSVTAVTDTKTYDGGVTSSASPIVGTLATGDAVLAAPTQVYDNKNIGTMHVLTASGLTIKDAGNVDVTANYTITYVPSPATGVINLKAVSVTAVTDTKTYDGGVTSSASPIVGTLATGDAVLAAPTQVYDDKNIGTTHVLTASGLTIKDAGNVDVTANYTITYVPSPATGVINLKAVSVTAVTDTKTYDGGVASSASPIVGTLATGDAILAAPTQVYDDKNIGTTHVLTASSLTIKDAGNVDVTANYTITYVPSPATGVINLKALSVTAVTDTKTYDGGVTSSASPIVGTLATGDAVLAAPTQVYDDKNVGTTHVLSASGLTIKDAGNVDVTANYTITYVPSPATGVINLKAVSVTAVTDTKTYDGGVTSSASPIVGTLATGDAVLAAPTQVYDNKNIGTTHVLSASGLTIKDAGNVDVTANYTITYVPSPATGVINLKAVSVTAVTDTKTYDGGVTSSASPIVGILATGDAVLAAPTQVYDNKNIGTTHVLTASGLTIKDAGNVDVTANYTITYVPSPATGVINLKAVSVTAVTDTKTYDGGVTSSASPIVGTLATGDAVLAAPTQVYDDKNVGTTHVLSASGLTIQDASLVNVTANYTITYIPSPATGVINLKAVSVTAVTDTKTYDGGVTSSASPIVGTLATGDAVLAAPTQVYDNKNIGTTHVLSASGLTIKDAGNVDVTANYTITYVPSAATGVINLKAVSVTAVTDTKTYDGGVTSSASPIVGTLATGDAVLAAPTQVYDDKNVGTTHVLSASGLTIKDGLNVDVTANYTITYVPSPATGVINLKAVSVTAVTDTKTYDGGVTSSASPIVGTLATGDAVLAAPTQVYDDKNIGTTHVLTASGLTIKDAGNVDVTANYTITYVPSPATGVINLKAVSVTAVTDTKTYDGGVTSSASPIVGILATGDAVLAAPTQVYDDKNIGTTHVLSASGLTIQDASLVNVTANYTITYIPSPATGVINLKAVSVTAVTDTKTYDGGVTSSASPIVGTLATGDAVLAAPTQVYDNKNIGTTHVLSASGLTIQDASLVNVTANYTITYVPSAATGVINLKAVSVTAVTDTKTYDGGVTSSASPIVGTLATGDAVLAAPTQVYDDKNIGTTHVLTASGLTIKDAWNVDVTANYTITYVPSPATGVINLKAVSVTAVTDTKTYDGGVASSASPIVGTLATGDAILAAPTQVYDDKNIGTTHVLSASGLTIQDASLVNVTANYTITYVPSAATGVINLKAVSVTAVTDTKTYDGGVTSSASPIVGTLATGDAVLAAPTQVYDNKNIGTTHVLSASGLTIKDAGNVDVTANYTITYVPSPATGVINLKAVSVTAVTDTKTYDGGVTSSASPIVGTLAAGDAVLAAPTQVYDNKNIGTTHVLTASGLTIKDAGNVDVTANYTITYVPSAATGVINLKAVSVTAVTDTKTYDGGVTSSASPIVGTLATGDAVLAAPTQVYDDKNIGTTHVLTASGLTIKDAGNVDVTANYTITYVPSPATGVINLKAVSVTAVTDTKTYDGGVTSSASPIVGTLATGDAVLAAPTQVYDDKNIGTTHVLTASGLTIKDAGNVDVTANYTITYVPSPATGVINLKAVSVTAVTDTKTYDGGVTSSASPIVGTLATGDAVLAAPTQVYDDKNVGTTHVLSASGLTIKGAGNVDVTANYTITYVPSPATGVINLKAVSVTAVTDTKTYDGGVTSSASPIVGTLATGDAVLAAPTQVYDNKNVGTTHVLSASGLTIQDASLVNVTANYTITYVPSAAIGVINLKAVSVTAVTDTKTYDGGVTSSASPIVGTLATGDAVLAAPTQVYDNKNIGTTHVLSASSLTIKDAGNVDVTANYTITYVPSPATGVITLKAVSVTAVTDTKTYDGGVTSLASPIVGTLATGDAVLAAPTQVYDDKNIGTTHVLTASGLTIKDAGNVDVTANYTITYVPSPATGVINLKAVSVTAVTDTKTYDGGVTSSASPIVGTLATGDAVLAAPTQVYDDKNIGTTHVLTASGLTIKDAGNVDVTANYTITYVPSPATGVINLKAVSVTAVTDTKTYDGGVTSSASPIVGTLATGDAVLAAPTQVYDNKNVGTTHVLSASGLTIKDAGNVDVTANYTITYVPSPATGVINLKAVSVTAVTDTKTYDGGVTSSASPIVGTLAAGDAVLAAPTQVYDNKNIGTTHVLTASGLAIKDAGNVDVTANYTITYVPSAATGVINLKAVSVTAVTDTKTYDGGVTSSASPIVGTLATGDAVLAAPTQVYDDKNVGTTHVLSASGLTIKDAGNVDVTANYTITYVPSPATGVINLKAVSVTAVTDTKTYDGGVTSSASPIVGTLATGDAVSAAPTQVYDDKNIGTTHVLTASGLTIKDAGNVDVTANYTITYVPSPATGVINLKAVSVTAVTDTKTYDGGVTSSASPIVGILATGDAVLAAPTQVYDNKNIGTTHVLTASGLTIKDAGNVDVTANYTITYVPSPATGVINLKAVSVTAVTDTKTYDGGVTSSASPIVGTLATGDAVLAAPTQVYDDKNVGTTHVLSASGLTIQDASLVNVTANYTITYVPSPATGVITAVQLTPHITAISKCYDGNTTAVLSAQWVTGMVNGETSVTLIVGAANFNTAAPGNGKLVTATSLSLGGPDASNYKLATGATATTTADIYPTPVADISVSTPISCHDGTGTVTITPTVGTAPFDFTFGTYTNQTGIFTGIPTGTYSWSFTDSHTCVSETGSFFVPEPAAIPLSGNINYLNSGLTPMDSVTVILRQGSTDVLTTITNAAGHYAFANVCPGDYTVVLDAVVNGVHKITGGVNTTDAANVNLWSVFPNPIQKVKFYTGDGVMTNDLWSDDAGRIMQYFLTLGTAGWVDRGSWTFWKTGETISENPITPPSGLQRPSVTILPLSGPNTQNFYAMVTGDFNGSFTPKTGKHASETLTLNQGETLKAGAGVYVELPVYAESAMEVGAVSMIMNFPQKLADIQGIYLAGDPSIHVLYSVNGDELRISWTSMTPMSLNPGDKLLTLQLMTSSTFGKDDMIRFTLADDELNELANGRGLVIGNAVLKVDAIGSSALGTIDVPTAKDITLTNYPNPFAGRTTIAYSLPVTGEVSIELRDMLGRVVMTPVDKEFQLSGDHKMIINAGNLEQGIYTATLTLNVEGQKMMRTIKIIRNN